MRNYAFDSGRPVLIIGTGVMGSLVAWACARSGMPVHAFDAETGRAQAALDECLGWSPEDEQRIVKTNFQVFDNLEQASSGVQLAFENTYEDLAVKTEILGRVARLLPPHVFMGSNASSLPSSPLAEASGRPDRFFNINSQSDYDKLLKTISSLDPPGKTTRPGSLRLVRKPSR